MYAFQTKTFQNKNPLLVGSLKLQVSFAEYSLFYRALLQKRHIILRSLLIVATPQQLILATSRVIFGRISYYGVAAISRLLKITCLFCRISSLLQGSFAKENYNFKEPTNRSRPIVRQLKSDFWQNQLLWGGYDQQAPENYRSLLQKSPIKETLFCKKDL